jgi:LPXTG-motif cell wall-anchored protein
MNRQGRTKKFKKVLGGVAIAIALCVTSIGSMKVNATEAGATTETADSETVTITIDNPTDSHVNVRFYSDSTKLDAGVWVYNDDGVWVYGTQSFTVSKGAVARIRLWTYEGYYLPEGYTVEGVTAVADGGFEAAYEITADAEKTITIPAATEDTTHSTIIYVPMERGHAQMCTLCGQVYNDTYCTGSFTTMTVTEYADWCYDNGSTPEWITKLVSGKEDLIAYVTKDLGVDANTKIGICTVCGAWDQESTYSNSTTSNATTSSTAATSSNSATSTAASTTSESTASIKDESGVLPQGTTVSSATLTSGDVYEKAAATVKEKISGLGQFAVMEINLTDASKAQIHELSGYVQVSIPVPSNINVNSGKAIVVYRLEDDGSLTRCQTTVENGVITFLTNHFSTYIVAEEDASANTDNGQDAVTSPKTGDDSYMGFVLLLTVLLAGMGSVAIAKRKMI